MRIESMQTAKQEIEAMARGLPDDATYEDAQYRLYVLEKIRKGQERIKRNGGIPQAEVERRLQKWLMK
jgi:hypothetical protein